MDKQREDFEKWAKSEGLIQESFGIRSVASVCDVAWLAWQAASLQPAQEPAKPVAYARADSEGNIIWGEDCVCIDPVYPSHAFDEDDDGNPTISLPLYRSPLPQSALSTDAQKVLWTLRQIARLDPKTDSIGTAIFMAREALQSQSLPSSDARSQPASAGKDADANEIPLRGLCYSMLEKHLSGYRVILGFQSLDDADAAQSVICAAIAQKEKNRG